MYRVMSGCLFKVVCLSFGVNVVLGGVWLFLVVLRGSWASYGFQGSRSFGKVLGLLRVDGCLGVSRGV